MTADTRFGGPFVITGLSGAGKTVLSRSLEDLGYFCVDNIPVAMVPELLERTQESLERLVVVLDVRTRGLVESFPAMYRELKDTQPAMRLVFVEASPEVLLKRFSVTRRPHPLRDRSLARAVADEQESLLPIRELADLIVDTTGLSPHDLRRQVVAFGGVDAREPVLAVEVQSFSYLQGVPPTASLVFDVRFLPNPYFQPDLRAFPGDDPAVGAWLGGFPEVADTIGRFADLALHLLPQYMREMRVELSLAVGCTGGRHRSVYVAEELASRLRVAGYQVAVHHRDKEHWRYT